MGTIGKENRNRGGQQGRRSGETNKGEEDRKRGGEEGGGEGGERR